MRWSLVLLVLFSVHLHASDHLRGYLGALVSTFEENKGALINNVFDESAASTYGLKENDIIIKIGSVSVNGKDQLIDQLKVLQWGEQITLTINRDGNILEQSVVLGYKKNTRTYNIEKIKDKDANVEAWHFENDATTIYINKTTASPISIHKIGNDGKTIYNLEDPNIVLPQSLMDLEDKLFIINYSKEDQSKRNSKAKKIVAIKTVEESPEATLTPVNEAYLKSELLKLIPNPNSGKFKTIYSSQNLLHPVELLIVDIKGTVVYEQKLHKQDTEIIIPMELKNISNGTYLLKLKQGAINLVHKFIVYNK